MLCDKEKCTGCYACANICPKNAIKMEEDEYGYIYPKIDKQLCISCKLCQKSCPSLNRVEFKFPLKCYAARAIDSGILKKTTSGGIATILSKKILENNGIVYGAAYGNNCEVKHIRIDNVNELYKLQGSKYVHSYIDESFKLVKKDLLDHKKVLFIGTPCQIAGLKKYLINDHENLYTVDLICHGVPSQKFLKDEVKRVNKDSIDIDRVNFRDKKYSDFTFSIEEKNKTLYEENWINNPYFYTFMKSITYRENCYHCIYAKPERLSDITIGDFWGIGENSKFYQTKENGLSVLLPISSRGLELINMIKSEIDIEERSIDEAIKGNRQLKNPASKEKKVEKFKKVYRNNHDFYKTYKKVCRWHRYKQKVKSIYIVNYIIRMIKGVNTKKNGKK